MRDWARTFVESPLAGSYKFVEPMSKGIEYSPGEWDKIMNVIKIKPEKRYATICPYCGAPHNPNEARCEYCDGYMKED